MIIELNERTRDIFRLIIDSYLQTGEPVGSKTLAGMMDVGLSSATIRNVMANLESLGLLYSPHTSAGRMPTQVGLRLYVDGLMEVGSIPKHEREQIESECSAAGYSHKDIYDKASYILSGLSQCAGLVVAPKVDMALKTLQFVLLEPGRVLVVLVMRDGLVENRIMEVPRTMTESDLVQAANYLNSMIQNKTINEAQRDIINEIKARKNQLNSIVETLVEKGLAVTPTGSDIGHIVIRGQSHLLGDVRAIEDLEKARELMAMLEDQNIAVDLLNAAGEAEGVQVFIGSENKMFSSTEWSIVLSPYKVNNEIVGAIGVIGPTRINYGRIVPIVDYTSKVMQKLLDRLQ